MDIEARFHTKSFNVKIIQLKPLFSYRRELSRKKGALSRNLITPTNRKFFGGLRTISRGLCKFTAKSLT